MGPSLFHSLQNKWENGKNTAADPRNIILGVTRENDIEPVEKNL